MANQTGIAIVIKAFLVTGKSLGEQFEALGIVKAAHETGDYTALLKAAKVEEVKTEQKTRRIEDVAPTPAASGEVSQDNGMPSQEQTTEDASGLAAAFEGIEISGTVGGAQMEGDDEPPAAAPSAMDGNEEADDAAVPTFLKKGKAKAA